MSEQTQAVVKAQSKTAVSPSPQGSALQHAAVNAEYPLTEERNPSLNRHFEHDFSKVRIHHHIPATMQTKLTIGQPGDQFEREADSVADAIMRMPASGNIAARGIGPAPTGELRRQAASTGTDQDKAPLNAQGAKPGAKPDNYDEAASKIGEAIMKTDAGKKINEWVAHAGKDLWDHPASLAIAGTIAAGAVAGLYKTHQPLPVSLPEIPLDFVKPGLSVKVTYEGPVDKPTKAALTVSFTPKKKEESPSTKKEKYRSETERMRAEQEKFREGLKTPQERKEDEEYRRRWLLQNDPVLKGMQQGPGGGAGMTSGSTGTPAPGSMQLQMPEYRPNLQKEGLNLPKLKLKDEEDETLQRKESNTASSATHTQGVPPIVHDVLHSSGQPLDSGTRAFMEPRFRHDFSGVRIHTDGRAAQSAQAVNAHAYTVGQDVVFGQGQYAPTTMVGRKLLAHELTHVVQQGPNPVAGMPTTSGLSISSPINNQEVAANEAASRVMAQSEFTPLNIRQTPSRFPAHRSSGITIQRFQAGETGHGGIEEEALIGKSTGLPANLQFTSDEESKIYIGNWLRDLSQLPPQAFFLINILALGEFGREITRDELGTYIPSEHLDNPEGGGTIEDPKLTKEERAAKKKELSPAQQRAYEEEEAHAQEIKDAAKASGLPTYIERGKYHAKQQLAKAIGYGRKPAGLKAMGDGLHAIEDYYSHSNFVEICIWYLHNKGQLTHKQYTDLVGTEVGNDATLLGNMSVPQGGPQIITGTYAPGANSKVSQLELLVTEVEHGQLTKAFIKGACRKLGITAKDILQKAAESGRSVGQTVGGAVGGALGGAVGAVGGAIKGAGEGAAKGWREHTGLSALWHGFTGLFTGAASGAASGARQGWNAGKSIGGAVGGAVGGVIGGAVGLTIDAVITLLGVSAMLVLFPVIETLRAAALAAIKAGIVAAKVKKNTLQAAQEAKSAGLGPPHAELAKDDPHHHLFTIARALAVHIDRDIGNAMAMAWEETRLRDESAKSQKSPSPEVVASVTGLVDKYVSHPATDQWWMDTVKARV